MLNIIVAAADNHVIGNKNRLPWYLPEDLRRFRDRTMGHTVVMGRKTFESLGNKELPGRQNAVATRHPEGLSCPVIGNLGDYLREVTARPTLIEGHEFFVIGGAQIYSIALTYAQRIFMTRVHWTPPGDSFFPMIDEDEWRKTSSEPRTGFTFETWERIA